MSHLKYIFFDLDGTLVDSSKGIQKSFEYSFKQLGKECPEESIIKSFMGPPLEVSFATVLEESQVPEAINYYRSFYKEKGIWGVRLYEGIPELLTQLKEAGYQIYVTTSKNQAPAQQFDDIFGSLPDSFHKADVLRRALQTLDANPEETIIIGDTKFDIIGGKEVGISTLGVLWGFGSQRELLENGADLLANSPKHILKILNEHFL